MKKIALFHPWIKSKGGAERVVLELLEKSKHNFDVYTWVYDAENTFDEFKKYKINILAPKVGKKLARSHILRGLFFPISLFKKIPLEKYDAFLISTSGVGEFIAFRNYKKGKTFSYVHTPLREATEKIVKWNVENRHNKFPKKQIYLLAVKIYRILEKRAWKKMDLIIFNSELSRSRAEERGLIKNKKIEIIHPPVDLKKFKKMKNKNPSRSFVYISRLNPPKRQDILIEAWKIFIKKHPKYTLNIIGVPDNKKYYEKLKMISKNEKSIKIMIKSSDAQFKKTISSALAGIFLGYQEDFGIVPLEILSAEKPLLAVDEGGYVKVVKNHPLFHKIKEKHSQKEMIKEVSKELINFIEKKKTFEKNFGKSEKIKIKNFVKEIDKTLEKN